MKKKKNKEMKSLTAVGAVVAAGLTSGAVTGTPATPPSSPEVEITAADVVEVNGEVLDFDELYASSQQVNQDQRRHRVLYGPPRPRINRDIEKARQEKARQENLRRDSISHDDEEMLVVVYGPPPATINFNTLPPLEELRMSTQYMGEDEAITLVQDILIDYIGTIVGDPSVEITAETDLSHGLLTSSQFKKLSQSIDDNYGLKLTEDMLPLFNTVDRIARFILESIKPVGQ